MRHKHLTVCRSERSRLIVDVARLGVVAVHLGDIVVAIADSAQQLTVHIVNVELHVARAVARQKYVVADELHALHGFLLHVLRHRFLHDELRNGAARVHAVEAKLVLMAVHGVYHHTRRVYSSLDARHVSVGVERHLKLRNLVRLDVVAPSRHETVVLARLGVLVLVVAGVDVVLHLLGLQALVHLQRVGLHTLLVIAQPANHSAVGVERERTVEAELLLVHPVGQAVDNLVALAVLRHLNLCVVIEQLHEEDIIVAHERHLQSVVRPHRHLLLVAVRKARQLVRSDGVYVVRSAERAAVDALSLGLYEHTCAVG